MLPELAAHCRTLKEGEIVLELNSHIANGVFTESTRRGAIALPDHISHISINPLCLVKVNMQDVILLAALCPTTHPDVEVSAIRPSYLLTSKVFLREL